MTATLAAYDTLTGGQLVQELSRIIHDFESALWDDENPPTASEREEYSLKLVNAREFLREAQQLGHDEESGYTHEAVLHVVRFGDYNERELAPTSI